MPSFGIVGVRSTAPPLVDYSGEALEAPFRGTLESFTEGNCHVLSNPYVHRTPATDSRRSADPTSRMGQAKWRISHMRLVRNMSYENARHFDAKGIQQTDRSSSSRTETGSNWKLEIYKNVLKLVELSLFRLATTYLGARAFVATRSK